MAEKKNNDDIMEYGEENLKSLQMQYENQLEKIRKEKFTMQKKLQDEIITLEEKLERMKISKSVEEDQQQQEQTVVSENNEVSFKNILTTGSCRCQLE